MSARSKTDQARPNALVRGGPLDALRFLAAFFMVLHHYSIEAPVDLATIHPAFGRGYLATDFFLIVSGYVLGRVYGERVESGRIGVFSFLLRRAARVVPAHLIVCLALVGLVLVCALAGVAPTHPEWFDWRELPAQASLTQSWVFVPGGKGWNAPTWSLSALLVCYATFPWVWRALRKIPSPLAALALSIAVLAAFDAATTRFLGYPVYEMPLRYGVIRAFPLFLVGLGMARVSEQRAIPTRWAWTIGLSALVGLVAIQSLGRFDLVSLSLISAVVICAGAIRPKTPSKLLERLALISFSIFITNEVVRIAYFGVAHKLDAHFGLSTNLQWGLWLVAPVLAVLTALCFHYGVDMPTQGWLKRRLGGAELIRLGGFGFVRGATAERISA